MEIKRKVTFAFIILIVAVGLLFWYTNGHERIAGIPVLHKKIASDDVKKIRMGIAVNKGQRIEFVDVYLSEKEVNQFLSLFNSVPEDRVREVQQVNPAIIPGTEGFL